MGGRSWGAGDGDDDASDARAGDRGPPPSASRTGTRWSAETRISRPTDDAGADGVAPVEDINATRVRPP
ncbi:MAG: hypothetical protein KC486_07275, partial [Myxococcales bacterium]|nr:hypothetical protein [Myxococcales bacterium]